MDTPVAGEVKVGDVGEKECSVGREAGQAVVVESQCLKAGHVPKPFPGESCQEISIQTQLPQGLQINKTAGMNGCDRVVGQPQEE